MAPTGKQGPHVPPAPLAIDNAVAWVKTRDQRYFHKMLAEHGVSEACVGVLLEEVKLELAIEYLKEGDQRRLRTILAQHGFSPGSVDALVRAMVPTQQGRGRPPMRASWTTRWAESVDRKRAQLRAQGVRYRVFEKALAKVELEHYDTAEFVTRCTGQVLPAFDGEKVRTFMRRSRQRRRP